MLPSEPVYTVSFFGHRVITDFSAVESRVEQLISTLLTHHQHVDFLVGRNGDFDLIVTAAIKGWQSQVPSDLVVFLLPIPVVEHIKRYATQGNEGNFLSIWLFLSE